MDTSLRRRGAAFLGGFVAISLLGAGCATAHADRVAQGAIAGSLAGAAIGAGIDHHDRGRGALIGGIGGLVIGAIFADELARHDWAHVHDEVEREGGEWCEEHHRYEPVDEEEAYEEEAEIGSEDGYEKDSDSLAIVVTPPDVLFDPGSTVISKGAQSRLQQLADSVRARTDLEVVLRGHADVSSREKDAFAISEKRAHEVRSFLSDEGVPWRRMRIVGLGSARPVASNDSPSGRQRNRRVEVLLRELESG